MVQTLDPLGRLSLPDLVWRPTNSEEIVWEMIEVFVLCEWLHCVKGLPVVTVPQQRFADMVCIATKICQEGLYCDAELAIAFVLLTKTC